MSKQEALTIYILLEDGDMTLHSVPTPIGVAVETEDEARQFVQNGKYRQYQKIQVFKTAKEAINHHRQSWEDFRLQQTKSLLDYTPE
jgi:hypothetical protein